MEFEWDEEKAAENLLKHDVSFEDATTSFLDDNAIIRDDPEHSDQEERSILLGATPKGRMIVVSYTLREAVIRLISAREATPAERREYANRA